MYYAQALIYTMQNINEIKENERFELSLSGLTPKDVATARKDRAAKKEKDREIRGQHQRDIEVAKAGAPKITINNDYYSGW